MGNCCNMKVAEYADTEPHSQTVYQFNFNSMKVKEIRSKFLRRKHKFETDLINISDKNEQIQTITNSKQSIKSNKTIYQQIKKSINSSVYTKTFLFEDDDY